MNFIDYFGFFQTLRTQYLLAPFRPASYVYVSCWNLTMRCSLSDHSTLILCNLCVVIDPRNTHCTPNHVRCYISTSLSKLPELSPRIPLFLQTIKLTFSMSFSCPAKKFCFPALYVLHEEDLIGWFVNQLGPGK